MYFHTQYEKNKEEYIVGLDFDILIEKVMKFSNPPPPQNKQYIRTRCLNSLH